MFIIYNIDTNEFMFEKSAPPTKPAGNTRVFDIEECDKFILWRVEDSVVCCRERTWMMTSVMALSAICGTLKTTQFSVGCRFVVAQTITCDGAVVCHEFSR